MKKVFVSMLCIGIMLFFSGCGDKEITLNLSVGDRTGHYSGDLVDGVPNGQGKFTSTNDNGESWTYEGEFKNGHFDGEGKITWKSGRVEVGTYKDDVIVPMKGDELRTLFTSPENFKNHCVEITGELLGQPEYGDGGVAVQMWADVESRDNSVIVYIPDPEFKIGTDEYLKITGIVGDVVKGTNAFGAELTAPTVVASKYEVLSYAEAVSPTLKEVEVNQTIEQYGYSVTVQKVEFAEKETRVYLQAENNGSDTFNLYTFRALIVQDRKQYKEQDNWDADYPDIESNLLVGNTTEGIIAFPALEQKNFSILIDASSSNYREDLETYQFDIVIE